MRGESYLGYDQGHLHCISCLQKKKKTLVLVGIVPSRYKVNVGHNSNLGREGEEESEELSYYVLEDLRMVIF